MNTYIYNTSLGKISISEENSMITHVCFNNKQLKNSELFESDVIKEAASQLYAYLDGQLKEFSLPLNPSGTEFMKKVWKQLLHIPYGKTASYKDIATFIGNPKACRAVGMANNKNPIGIIIPCHRVIGANGKLVGYAGGLNIKQKLLQLENKN